MTGAQDAGVSGRCAFCGGGLARGTANVPFSRGERVFVVKGVPAEVCGDCGEPYLDGPTLDRVLAIFKQLEAADAEVSVARYRAA